MSQEEQKTYMQRQIEAIEAEYKNLTTMVQTLGLTLPPYQIFTLLWIRLRAEEFRRWFENSNNGNFPLSPDYFIQIWSIGDEVN